MKKKILSLAAISVLLGGCAVQNETANKNLKEHEKITDVNHDDSISETALHDAVRAKDQEIVKYLLSRDVKTETKDIYGYTPLHIAVRLNQLDIAKALIEKKASVNTIDNYMDTPLLDSTRNNFTEMSQLLICNGAYRNVKDQYDMSPLHNSSKNNNLFISKMLRAEDLKPYCSPLGTVITDMDKAGDIIKISGHYSNEYEPSSKLTVAKGESAIGAYDASGKWRSEITDPLQDGIYDLSSDAQDKINRKAKDTAFLSVNDDIKNLYNDKFRISIQDLDELETNTPEICGEIKEGEAKNINVDLVNTKTEKKYGSYKANIDKNSWCIDKTDPLDEGNYIVKAKGIDPNGEVSVALDDTFLVKKAQEPQAFVGLYDALMEEFKDDFGPWNAELTKDDLLFRFNDPDTLFEVGESDLKERFTNILSDFFPRYLKVLESYKGEIAEIRIEGHTSSEFRTAKSDKQKYALNKKLSQERADKVAEYSIATALKDSELDGEWVKNTFKPYGMAYDNLILNADGVEDMPASRRVEFKIEKK